MTRSKIEWTDFTWNPVSGCSKVSEGCRHCYAERMDRRQMWRGRQDGFREWTAQNAEYNVRLHPERLEQPLHWRKPRRVFVCSTGDLFHEQVPDRYIAKVFAVMVQAREHTFQILTKREKRMNTLLMMGGFNDSVIGEIAQNLPMRTPEHWYHDPHKFQWPLSNVWLGVSAEDQKTFDERARYLLQTPVAKRFVSLEPLLGPIVFPRADFSDRGHGPCRSFSSSGGNGLQLRLVQIANSTVDMRLTIQREAGVAPFYSMAATTAVFTDGRIPSVRCASARSVRAASSTGAPGRNTRNETSVMIEWEPETQALINAAELEVRPEDVNTAVRQWLRHILNHRKYLERIKSDPDRLKKFKATEKAYNRQYRQNGPKRNRPKERERTDRLFAEGYAERVARCIKEDRAALIRDRGRLLEREKGAL